MRRVLAITIVLMFVALMLSPAMGYSVQSGNHSYSIESTRVNYSISPQAPSHEPAVVVSSRPYSTLKYGALFQPEATGVGETAKSNVIGLSTPYDTAIQARTNTPAVPLAEPRFSIQGTVYSDQNGNGKMDSNETGLENWTLNLEQPQGNVISKATTSNDGRYGFYSLVPGEYSVVENLETGWSLISPSNSKYAVNLTSNATMLNFGNKMMPAPAQNMTAPEDSTILANSTMDINATLPKVA
ncbi:SdrD B-like domain protein [uncultured archaeon]|nr:SdrD B-like domain protein [uncultured archaeon]